MTRAPRRGGWRIMAVAALAAALAAPPASAHVERETSFPSGKGRVPTYRQSGPRLLVCKGGDTLRRIRRLKGWNRQRNLRLYRQCRRNGFRHIQAAVDAVRRSGTRIMVLPGVYREGPSRRAGNEPGCRRFGEDDILTYRQQKRCPHAQNLIGIFGDGPDRNIACNRPMCRLQIEGTGTDPLDVVVDNGWSKLNAIRADRADGIYLRNFTVQRSEFNSVYILETDGFAIDRVLARWNEEYGFLTFASDHGIYKRCTAYGNGDGGVYPGSAADHHGERVAIEIRRCHIHHNAIGISGTAGNSLLVRNNRIHHNSTGITMDSFFPDHPGLPQDSSRFVRNRIWSNNVNYYRYWADGTCDNRKRARRLITHGVVCPVVPVPVGTGLLIAGGNHNVVARNQIYDNWRFGTMQFAVPAAFRNETDPLKAFDTSHSNRYLRNRMGVGPGGRSRPNGTDFWWDVQGTGNCWQGNASARGREITSDPPVLPDCGTSSVAGLPASPKQVPLAPCATWSRENHHPPGCDWMERPARPE